MADISIPATQRAARPVAAVVNTGHAVCAVARRWLAVLRALGGGGRARGTGVQSMHTGACARRVGLAIAVASGAMAWTATAAVAQAAERAEISIAPTLLADPASETAIVIRVGPPNAIPRNAFVRIRGLPARVALSEGHAVAAGSWAVPLFALANLRATIPAGTSGRSDLIVSLVGIDGEVLAETRSALVVAPLAMIAPAERKDADAPVIAATLLPVAPPVPAGKPAQRAEPKPDERMEPRAAPRPEAQPAARAPIAIVVPPPPPAPANEVLPARPAPLLPVAPTSSQPRLAGEELARAERFTGQGDKALALGNIANARQFFLRAAESGHGAAALKLAATYDPVELAGLPVQGLTGDLAEARKWYARARDLGEREAESRLARLGSR